MRSQALPTDLVPLDAASCEPNQCAPTYFEPAVGAAADGWKLWQCWGELPNSYPRALMQATSAPVLTGFVLHSDSARVDGLGPRTGRWGAYLMVGGAVAYMDIPITYDVAAVSDEEARAFYEQAELEVMQRLQVDYPGGAATAQQALAWAQEAGLTASADTILEILDGHRVFAEELFLDLVTALGIGRFEI